jgi:hypothetical protein
LQSKFRFLELEMLKRSQSLVNERACNEIVQQYLGGLRDTAPAEDNEDSSEVKKMLKTH